MTQHDMIEGAPSSSAPASEAGANATPKMALAGGDTGGKVVATPKPEATSAPKLEAATVAPAPRTLAGIETLHAAPDTDGPPCGKHAADADGAAAESAEGGPNVSRFTLLAAALALAAALGAMVGALAAYGVARPG